MLNYFKKLKILKKLRRLKTLTKLKIFIRFIASFIKRILLYPLVILSIVAVGLLIFTIANNDKVIWLDSTMEEVSKKNKYVEIVSLKDNFIKIQGKNCKSYKLKPRSDLVIFNQPFSTKKYIRSEKEKLLKDREKVDNLCGLLENIDRGVISSDIIDKFSNDNWLGIVAEIAFNTKGKENELHLFVKGYADGTDSKWSEKLEQDFDYTTIDYYPMKNKIEEYLITENNIITHKIKDNLYSNTDLPFLRANFVYEQYLEKLKGCSERITKTGILEGEVIHEKAAELRNTEIYIAACYSNRISPGCSGNN